MAGFHAISARAHTEIYRRFRNLVEAERESLNREMIARTNSKRERESGKEGQWECAVARAIVCLVYKCVRPVNYKITWQIGTSKWGALHALN